MVLVKTVDVRIDQPALRAFAASRRELGNPTQFLQRLQNGKPIPF